MDYEKEYKGALARCKWLLSIGMISEIAATDMFRELIDNNSENVRKEIINILHSLVEGKIPVQINFADIFTWLEMQKTSYTKRDVDDAYLKGISDTKNELEKQGDSPIKWNKNTEGNKPQVNHSVLMKTTYGIAEGEWKGEYWEQYRWAGIVRDSDVLSWMELSDLDKQGKQKPTLRERYKNIAESEWFKKTHEGMSVSDDEKVDNVNKIEQESAWSCEDETRLQACIDTLQANSLMGRVDTVMTNWLKSLKDRYTWKPSIAQLNALSIVSKGNAPDDIEEINSLYNDLKKLREE